MSKPTPLPWQISEIRDTDIVTTPPRSARIVARCYGSMFSPDFEVCAANAQFIVKAVNSHDELVQALREVLTRGTYNAFGDLTLDAQGVDNLKALLLAEDAR